MTHTSIARRAIVLSALVTLAACTSGDGAETPSADAPATSAAAGSDAELKPITEYELTMRKVDQYFEAQRNMSRIATAMSPAQREAVKRQAEESEEGSDEDVNEGSMEEMAARFERHPVLGPGIKQAGLSAREYATIMTAMMQAGMAQSVLAMRPNDNQDSLMREMKVNPANVRFMRQHQDEIARKGEAVAAEMKAAGLSGD